MGNDKDGGGDMRYKWLGFGMALGWLVFPALAEAAKTTYIFTDRKYHFVKRVELDKKELKERGEAAHPQKLEEGLLHQLLSSVHFNRKLLLKKEVEAKEVFNTQALGFLIPHLTKALAEAKPNEQIVFSYITYDAKALFRDNRITLAEAWVQDPFLHIYFRKLMAKIDTTKYDKFSDVSRAINRAKGLRVSLELNEGQEFGDSTDEILLPLAGLPKAAPEKMAEEKAAAVTPPPEAAPPPVAEQEESPEVVSGTEQRLRELEELKKKGLVSKKEYEAKRKEILGDL